MFNTANLGYPRIGKKRELKFALEKYWRSEISLDDLKDTAYAIRGQNWKTQKEKGIDVIPVGDFSLYDHVLDHAVMFGAIPSRFKELTFEKPEDLYFSMARGYQSKNHPAVPAMEMTKWFNTNYHYIVPEINPGTTFSLNEKKLFDEIDQASELNINIRPVILGPVSFLLLSKSSEENFLPIEQLNALLPIYDALFTKLKSKGIEWIQLDEPFLVSDLTPLEKQSYLETFNHFKRETKRPKVMLTTYFADLSLNIDLVNNSPFEGIHVDLINTKNPAETVRHLKYAETISLGLSNGRNIWRENIEEAIKVGQAIINNCDGKQILVAPSCSMVHLPYDINMEDGLDHEIKTWMAFAEQKLSYLTALKKGISGDPSASDFIQKNQEIIANRANSSYLHAIADLPELSALSENEFVRNSRFSTRKELQEKVLKLPKFPTTTIGSFPQTKEIRKARSDFRKGIISESDYHSFIKNEIKHTIAFQESIGMDVLVHGEFERNDMVQYFAEKLSGFVFTKNGWVQSFGSRCVRPPIIFGDVSRADPMTIEWISYAQSLTNKPVKGMLTGPVTILQWSFVRDDQPRSETCKQIAYAIRDEVMDLERAGTSIIQIDEPALREGLPIQQQDWDEYLTWAVNCFRISSSGVSDKTQIHTHMCYAEFNDIIDAIVRMDADVISIEASRSNMELLDAFSKQTYPNEIGPGVYDIHSPNIPSKEGMISLLKKALEVIPTDQLWVNPDCGLKTRQWIEVEPALKNMVNAARSMRNL